MRPRPAFRIPASVLGSPDPRRLGRFCADLLAWDVVADEPGWVQLKPPSDHRLTGLSFQLETGYVRPVWPANPGRPADAGASGRRRRLSATTSGG